MELISLQVLNGLILILTLLLFTFVPSLSRKNLVFGVRFPHTHTSEAGISAIHCSYRNRYLVTCGTFTLVTLGLASLSRSGYLGALVLTGQAILFMAFFHLSRKEAQTLKLLDQPYQDTYQVTAAYTKNEFLPKLPSPGWFIPSLLIVTLFILLSFLHSGNADLLKPSTGAIEIGMRSLSYRFSIEALFPAVVQCLVLSILFFAFSSIRRAKRFVQLANPCESTMKEQIFRFHWSLFILVTATLFAASSLLFLLNDLGFFSIPETVASLGWPVIAATIVIYAVFLSFKLGQGGQLSQEGDENTQANDRNFVNRDDDKFWKAGMFYYNPDDPALWIEKRVGIGYTLNFAHRAAVLIMLAIFLAVITVALLPRFLALAK